jgi:hypothetical protein
VDDGGQLADEGQDPWLAILRLLPPEGDQASVPVDV